MTPAQIAGLQDKLEGDIEMLDGHEELSGDLQEKVKQAFDNGHVDDEDWKGVCSPCQKVDLDFDMRLLRIWSRIVREGEVSALPLRKRRKKLKTRR